MQPPDWRRQTVVDTSKLGVQITNLLYSVFSQHRFQTKLNERNKISAVYFGVTRKPGRDGLRGDYYYSSPVNDWLEVHVTMFLSDTVLLYSPQSFPWFAVDREPCASPPSHRDGHTCTQACSPRHPSTCGLGKIIQKQKYNPRRNPRTEKNNGPQVYKMFQLCYFLAKNAW